MFLSIAASDEADFPLSASMFLSCSASFAVERAFSASKSVLRVLTFSVTSAMLAVFCLTLELDTYNAPLSLISMLSPWFLSMTTSADNISWLLSLAPLLFTVFFSLTAPSVLSLTVHSFIRVLTGTSTLGIFFPFTVYSITMTSLEES